MAPLEVVWGMDDDIVPDAAQGLCGCRPTLGKWVVETDTQKLG
jgi:hypothetical protein